MAETKDYVVTKLAGPKVAGQRVQAGKTVTLTENEARSELLSGAIVDPKDKDRDKDPLAGTEKLADIQSRAAGFDNTKDEEQQAEPSTSNDLPPPPPPAEKGTGKANAKS